MLKKFMLKQPEKRLYQNNWRVYLYEKGVMKL